MTSLVVGAGSGNFGMTSLFAAGSTLLAAPEVAPLDLAAFGARFGSALLAAYELEEPGCL